MKDEIVKKKAEVRKGEYATMREMLMDAILNFEWTNQKSKITAIYMVMNIDRGIYDLNLSIILQDNEAAHYHAASLLLTYSSNAKTINNPIALLLALILCYYNF